MTIRTPYLLFIGDAPDQLAAKTADGIAFWRPDISLGQLRLPGCKADLRLPDMTVEEAAAAGVKTIIVGTTNRGGVLGEGWEGLLVRAMELGMDLASGLHHRLTDIPALRDAAARHGRQIADVRHPTREFAVGTGIKRPGKRLLTVGTDCSIGKMFTALALEKEMRARGFNADFRATGQTGIFIAGDGVSIDAVVSDFVSGAVEWLCPANDPDHWDLIEGQGSLFHASYAGVTLGLIHGASPTRWSVPRADPCPYAGPADLQIARPEAVHRPQRRGGAADQSGGALVGISVDTSGARSCRFARLSAPHRGRAGRPVRRCGAHRGRRNRRSPHSLSREYGAASAAARRHPPRWPPAQPSPMSRGSRTTAEVVIAEVSDGEFRGRGECVPYPRYGESVESVAAQLEAIKGAVFSGLDRHELQRVMPPGAARNALDCAFWDSTPSATTAAPRSSPAGRVRPVVRLIR